MAKSKSRQTPRKTADARSRIPLWLILTGVGLLMVVLWAYFANSNRGGDPAKIEVTGAPRIKVNQEMFDYGEVQLGVAPIRTEVEVTNVGDQTLRFSQTPYIQVLEGC